MMHVVDAAQSYKLLVQLKTTWPVVVAQLAEQSLPTPEVRSSNPVISEFLIKKISTILKNENKEQRGREWSILKTIQNKDTSILVASSSYYHL